MLDAYIINSIRDAEPKRDPQRPQVVVEIDPPGDLEDFEERPEPEAERGPIIIPLRPDDVHEEDDAA